MSAEFIFILSLSILFPFLTGVIRIRTVKHRHLIMLVLFGTGLLAELLSRYALTTNKINWVNVNNCYILIESILIPLQFYAWGYLKKERVFFFSGLVIMLCGWIAEHLVLGDMDHLHPYYRMFYSLVIVLLSINTINYLVIHEDKRLVAQPVFIMCCGFIIFFTYQLVYEGIYSIVTNLENIDTGKLNTAFSVINSVCNVLYGLAFLLLPARTIQYWLDKKPAG